MTATQRSVTDAIALLASLPAPADRRLHVAEPVWRFLRNRYLPTVHPTTAEAIYAMPIVVDDDLTGGQWQLREDGEVHTAGDMAPAPDGMTVTYSPTTGWIAIRTDLVEVAPAAEWRTP